ncbi:MAG TPA: acetate--CoA ligase, partial [Dehalococcoidia bacterium]|nr:acetate--CoA ligase [Dehalococcoidia bacterium]
MTRPDWDSTDRVLTEKRLFRPSRELVEQSNLAAYLRSLGFEDWDQLYSWSIERPDEFWSHLAQELHWFKNWDRVLQWEPPYAKWFTGAQCNIVYNALDRHMQTFRRNKVAFYWEGEDGSARTISYAELYRDVNRFASALRAMGVERGDRVSIYLPRIPEQIIAMLGTARIGAVHSVTYSGFSAQALRERIEDAEAKVVVTADGYYYRGKVVGLKGAVDAAVEGCPSVQKVVVVPRLGSQVPMVKGRDLFWEEALALGGSQEPCAVMDSGDLLYILYTSGTTGKPKGVVHVHGGYMVGIYATLKLIFDTKEADIYWCTADPGWVTGHSYIVYAPLIAGITSVFYEGAIDYPDPGRWWSIIEKYQVSVLYTTPTAIRGLMRFGDEWPARHDLSCLRLLGTVGEPINPEAWIWYRRVTGDRLPIMDTWWQTETGMQMITPTIPLPLKPGSAGKPFLGIVADVVDRQGNQVGADKGGFLIIRGPWPAMMSGIYKDPARYEEYWTTIRD